MPDDTQDFKADIGPTDARPGMGCPTLATLVDYLQEQLSVERRETVEEHVEQCDTCEAFLERLTASREDLRVAKRVVSPSDTCERANDARPDVDSPRSAIPRADVSLVGVHLGPYQLKKRIATGGFGDVYLALRTNVRAKSRHQGRVSRSRYDQDHPAAFRDRATGVV